MPGFTSDAAFRNWHRGDLNARLLNERCFSYSRESGWVALGALTHTPYTCNSSEGSYWL